MLTLKQNEKDNFADLPHMQPQNNFDDIDQKIKVTKFTPEVVSRKFYPEYATDINANLMFNERQN